MASKSANSASVASTTAFLLEQNMLPGEKSAVDDVFEVFSKVQDNASARHLKPGHPMEELRAVEDSVGYAEILTHGVVGKGMNNYPQIFRTLREARFDGWVSIEDGLGGLEEIRASAEFLRPFIDFSGLGAGNWGLGKTPST
jgi:hypothetical protein